jgi:pyruvate,water dikinase
MTVYQELTKPSSTDAAADRVDSREEIEKLLVAEPRWRWSRFVTGQVMDVRRRFLRREAIDAAEFLQRRERTKACVLILGGVVRRANLEIGRRLADRGVLEMAEDVELLGVNEIPVLTGAAGPSPEILASRRRRNLEAKQAGPLPTVWTGVPTDGELVSVDGEQFEGWSASPGHYEGLARIVESPATSRLRRGEILVATTTDASWAPLFMAAGAIVVEQGGPLSHAAIVARELGIPTVVNVPGFIARLRRQDGPVPVVVGGTQGTVTILTSARQADPRAAASEGDAESHETMAGRT